MAPQAYPRVRLRRTTNLALATAAETTVPWQSADYDSAGGWSASSAANYNITLSGLWVWHFSHTTTLSPDPNWQSNRLYLNGVILRPNTSGYGGAPLTLAVFMVPGDVVQARIFCAAAGLFTAAANTVLTGYRIATDP